MALRSAPHNIARGILDQRLAEALAEKATRQAELRFRTSKINLEGKMGEELDKWAEQHVVLGPMVKLFKEAEEKVERALDAHKILDSFASTMKD